MKKWIWLLLILLLIWLGFYLFNKNSLNKNISTTSSDNYIVPSSTLDENTPATSSTTGTKIITLNEVQTHNSKASCWTIIGTKVYDLTTYVDKHPAGPQLILDVCGKDGSKAFNDEHGTNTKIVNYLQSFFIGNFAN